MATITIPDETYTRLEDLANQAHLSKEELLEVLLSSFQTLVRTVIAQHHTQGLPLSDELIQALLAQEAAHPVFTDEVAWMKHLGMPDEDIAWVMAQPTEPEPGEAYIDADA